MDTIRLSDWATNNNMSYLAAHRKFSKGQIEGAYKDDDGHIKVRHADVVIPTLPVTEINQADTKIPSLKYENISMANMETRSNKAADGEIINRFSNIDSGIVPYMSGLGGGVNKTGITIRDTVILTQKAYFNVAIFRQIIDLIVDLSIGSIFVRGGNKKSRDFIKAYLRKIDIDTFQEHYFLELWRSGNVITYSYDKDIKQEDIKKITNTYGLEESMAAKKVRLPIRFSVLNPADVQVSSTFMFLNPIYYKILNGYELECLKNPKTDTDMDALKSLPADVQEKIKDKKIRTLTLQLPSECIYASFYKKQDYEGLAIPVFFPVLDDINWKLQLRKMDIATTRMMNQAILLVTTGTEPEKGGINPQNITNLQQIFLNESVGRVLIADYTTKAQFIIPQIATILDPKKYETVNNDIYIGLNYILLQGEKFANKQTALQIFIEKINYGRHLFLRQFLNKVIEKVCREIGFKNYPEAYFEEVKISDKTERDRIITQLAQYGHLTPKEVFEALDNGRMPLAEDSLDNQEEYKEQRDRGLYQPLTGGPASQMELLKETNKHAVKLQDKTQEHEAKQNSQQRKHDAANPPPAPPPAIHIGTNPKVMKEPTGRPKGTKRKQSTKRIKPSKASIISGSKVIENTILYDKLNRDIVNSLLTKYNLKSLNETQLNLAEEMAKMIVMNEDSENWINSIPRYIEKPENKNTDRINEITSLAYEHQLEEHLAGIVFASLAAEDIEDAEINTSEDGQDTSNL